MYKWLILLLVVIGLCIWAYVLGIEVTRTDSIEVVYGQYNHIQMYEDGSYQGQTIDGVAVSGCIKGALCND